LRLCIAFLRCSVAEPLPRSLEALGLPLDDLDGASSRVGRTVAGELAHLQVAGRSMIWRLPGSLPRLS
ncbi:MAG: hypothetical protein PF636_03085, partial [Actinomycetota bacterium]|nr:hypothetical protein [Actinomycetota bacterium]